MRRQAYRDAVNFYVKVNSHVINEVDKGENRSYNHLWSTIPLGSWLVTWLFDNDYDLSNQEFIEAYVIIAGNEYLNYLKTL